MNGRLQGSRGTAFPGKTLLLSIVAVCCLVEALSLLADFGVLPVRYFRALVYDYAAFWPGLLRDWQPNYPLQPELMFITYGFLHGGLAHLGFNMVTLWSLGRIVLLRIGAKGFAIVYAASLVGGAGLFGFLSDTGRPMVGASGALFGLAGAILLWVWRAQPSFEASLRATWRIYAFLILYNVVMYYALSGALAWEAHLGGFVAGWLVARLFEGEPK